MNRFRNVILAATVPAIVGSAAFADVLFATDPTPRLDVVGIGEVEAVPDMATVSLGVYVLDPNLRKAKSTSDASVSKLLQIAGELSIASADVSSSVIDIEPRYSDADTPAFLGYEVSRSLTIILHELTKLDQLIDAAIDAGANREFNVALSSSHLPELQEKAMSLAIEDARAQAQRLAEGFGARLGAVRQIGPRSGNNTMRMATGTTVSFGAGTFTPGTIKVRSEISVTFLLEQ